MRNRAILMLGLAVVFAVVAAFLAQSWLRSQVSNVAAPVVVQQAPKAPETTIVVARQPLFYGNELTRQNVREIPWLANELPTGTFRTVDELFADQPTRIVLRTMEQNEPVLESKISGDNRAATMSAVIPLKMRAITIRVNDIVGVAGFIIPGDRVDMLLTRSPSEGGRGKLETTMLLQNVQILGIDQIASEDQDKPRVVRAITIAVTPTQAQKVVLATSVGSLTLALRNRGDADPAQATRITLADLGIGEAFRPAGSGTTIAGPAPSPRRRGTQVAVARGLAVVKYTVEREKFEPLSPTQLAPSLSSSGASTGEKKDDSASEKSDGKAPVAETEQKDATPAPLLPPDRVNF